MGNDNGGEVTHYAKNVYTSEDALIYFFSNGPHLVKTVGNGLSNSGSGKGTRYKFEYPILIYIVILQFGFAKNVMMQQSRPTKVFFLYSDLF